MTPATMFKDPFAVPTTEDLFVTGIMYEVPLFTGFAQQSSVEIAALQKEMAGAAVKLSREQLIYNVKTLYVTILSLQSQEKAQRSYIKALQRLFDDISREFEVGTRARIDTLKAAADLEKAKSHRAQMASSQTIATAALTSLLNVEQLPELEEIKITIKQIKEGEAGSTAQIQELERYRKARLEIVKSEKLIQKSNAALYPQISLNAFYGQNFGTNDNSNVNSGDWKNKEVWQAGVNIKWNIFDFGEQRSALQKARIARQQSLRDRLQTELELKRLLTEALTRIETAIVDYKSAETEFALTRETETIEQTRFDMGAGDINDLLQAKARNQLALSRFISAGYSYKNARFYLDYLLESGERK